MKRYVYYVLQTNVSRKGNVDNSSPVVWCGPLFVHPSIHPFFLFGFSCFQRRKKKLEENVWRKKNWPNVPSSQTRNGTWPPTGGNRRKRQHFMAFHPRTKRRIRRLRYVYMYIPYGENVVILPLEPLPSPAKKHIDTFSNELKCVFFLFLNAELLFFTYRNEKHGSECLKS